MNNFKVAESGWYRTRDGGLAEVVINRDGRIFVVVGYIVGCPDRQSWQISGHFGASGECHYDLIEYLGKERPKQPKKYCVKVHLWSDGTLWQDSDGLVAVNSDGPFYVETREIEWAVPDNG